jgi:hypothetical protein
MDHMRRPLRRQQLLPLDWPITPDVAEPTSCPGLGTQPRPILNSQPARPNQSAGRQDLPGQQFLFPLDGPIESEGDSSCLQSPRLLRVEAFFRDNHRGNRKRHESGSQASQHCFNVTGDNVSECQ